jgi:site-specific DNA recombinase
MRSPKAASDRSGSGKTLRCAIYTRKSTDEGLDQAFNSLDAQREACAAYLTSQQHEGWILLPDSYEDGGFSGSNLDRPGLQQLLAEVKAGRVDVIIVYKVDRLTRSLADFARIVDVLDGAGASFVSITQAFNTTTSMGRLTLNVLLSFAQFEREVISERVRDKIAASKAKGMWMGGPVPPGYRIEDRKLIVDEAEAKTVRSIMAHYLIARSVPNLADILRDAGIVTKVQTMRDGSTRGGIAFTRGPLYHLLKNRIYRGEIVHKDKVYPGEHKPIVDAALFDKVQQMLADRAGDQHRRQRASAPSLLTGMIRDGGGRAMSPRHAVKQGRRYRYYVSQTNTPGTEGLPDDARITRLAAGELDDAVRSGIMTLLQDGPALVEQAQSVGIDDARQLLDWSAVAARKVAGEPTARLRGFLHSVGLSVSVDSQSATATLNIGKLLAQASGQPVDPAASKSLPVTIAIDRRRYGHEMRLSVAPTTHTANQRNPKLFNLIVRAFAAQDHLLAADAETAAADTSTPHLLRIARLAYLAPDMIAAILDGDHSPRLSARDLAKAASLPLGWTEQRRRFGFR